MNVAEYIVESLMKQGICHVFGYQGGNITYVIDAIGRRKTIHYIQTYHEQGAAFAANAYAQVTGKFGVAISSSGPGAINMINGIANAYYDSIPCLFITGNITTYTMRDSDNIRQNGFQEADIVSMVKGITKYAVTIRSVEDVPKILEYAILQMKTGRPGPVLLDIPHDVQRAEINYQPMDFVGEICESPLLSDSVAMEIVKKMENASQPVLLLGGGCRSEVARREIHTLLQKMPVPVVVSLCGIDVLPNDHECYRGMIGDYGHSYSNQILQEADLVLVLGSRLDERQRCVSKEEFLKNADVVRVDIDRYELQNAHGKAMNICMSVEKFVQKLNEYTFTLKNSPIWLKETREWQQGVFDEKQLIFGSSVQNKLEKLIEQYVQDRVVCVDVGCHQMAAAQAIKIGKNSNYLNSGGLGSMGYALPAAIGAYYGKPDRKIICVAGDGGIMMNLQELQVIARERLPIMIIIMNNNALGMIKAYQDVAFEGRNYGSCWGYVSSDFQKIADAFEIDYYKVDETLGKEIKLPAIIEIEV